ncbi:MAG: DUF2141 domain-containing protein [Oceanicaulis sp.]
MLASLTAQVVLTLTGVETPTGDIYIQLCREETFLKEGCAHQAVLPPQEGVVHTFDSVAPGRWAATAWHDADGDGVMKTGLFEIPAEPVAISNDPRALFGPPDFAAAAIDIGGAPVSITLRF